MTSRSRARPTVRQVAAAAGVSAATVSNVMTGTGRMSEQTRERVLAAARELGYRPWTSLHAGAHGGTGVIGLTLTVYGDHPTDYLSIPFYRDLVVSAMAEALRRGYLLLVLPSSMTSWAWMSTPIDGVIHCEPRADDPVRALLLRRGIPMVSAGRPERAARDECWVDAHTEAAVEHALDHLTECGARRPALLLPDHDDAYPAQLRAGCRAWSARSGVPVRIESFPVLPDYAVSERKAALTLLDGPGAPDAVIGAYEYSGLHLLEAAARSGRRVPEDLRIVAISDNPSYASTDPSVTTVSQGADELGAQSVDLLIDLMHGTRRMRRRRLVAPVLHVRRSTGRALPSPR